MGTNGQLQASAALPQGKHPRYQIIRMEGEPQGWSGRVGDDINLLPLPGIEVRYLVLCPANSLGHYTDYPIRAYVKSL